MIAESTIILALALTGSVLAGILVCFAILYSHALEKLHHTEKANQHLQGQLNTKPEKIMQEAHERAVAIINDANRKAEDILSGTTTFESDAKKSLQAKLSNLTQEEQAALQQTTDELRQTYQHALLQIKEDNLKLLQSIAATVEKDAETELTDFKNILKQETVGAQKLMQEKTEKDYDEVKKEIEAYKATKLQEIDEHIYQLLYRVSELVLSKGLSLEQEQELVLKALEQAKKEEVFT